MAALDVFRSVRKRGNVLHCILSVQILLPDLP